MDMETIKEWDGRYVAGTYGRFPLAAEKGAGAWLTAVDGKEYVDFTSGIGVNALGFCDPDWTAAVARQAATLNHVSNLYYSVPMVTLAKTLCERTGYDKVFFANSGAEANEGAIKTARKYSQDKYGEDRYEILTLVNSFHGRTVTTLAATGQAAFHEKFMPLTAGFAYAQAGDLEAIKEKVNRHTCAVMLEFIQGEGGVVPLDRDFVQKTAAYCAEKDLLLIADEVQTGVGRTGTFLASEQFGIKPDITTLAKGLGGGLPIGAVLMGEKCADTLGPGDHGSTFGGNPIAAAGALEVLKKVDDTLLAETVRKGAYIRRRVQAMPMVKSVTGLGLMIGVEFTGCTGKEAADRALGKGAMFLTAKQKLRMLPPLTITDAEIDRGMDILQETLTELQKEKEK